MSSKQSPASPQYQLAKAYEFRDVEDKWYRWWQEHGTFRATMAEGRPSFSIVIPPPNVTGVLHVGHALNNTLQDILVRYRRMQGYNTLWVPGTDHAGIATQNVVERQLASEGKSRHHVGREAFVARVWQWKEESGGQIIHQLKRLGCSCDWERERFTMDEGLSRAVREVFVRLYEEGLIYRGDYIINWCPRCHTALADLEVEHEPTDGKLYHIRYPLADGSGHLVVATTRPETMLGDTAVAVHPADERYTAFHGKEVLLPLVERRIPIVCDTHVDREFGTGALKVTPAHDLNDFEIARRHDLPHLKVMDDDGRMNEAAGPYSGLDRFACRERVVADLTAKGLLAGVEDHQHGVGHCYRCHTVVEPALSKQWFVKVAPLAEAALAAVKEGRTRILPAMWQKTYYEWMTNIRDWCISRQIWWGHQIPAWTCGDCGELVVSRDDPDRCPACGSTALNREEDVLDTWFSSALWPFSTLGWPEETPELRMFYPTSTLITSFDILFFWVARMMMMGIHFMGEVPFRDVYLHALVRDEHGQKMSKSKGNVLDPLELMDKYGTDALRFTLAAFAAQGRDIKLAETRIDGYRRFVNKLWNAARFALPHLEACDDDGECVFAVESLDLVHQWILSRTNGTVREVCRALDDYDFNVAAEAVYQFTWHEFCDWYLEWIKPVLYGDDAEEKRAAQGVLLFVLDTVLRLLHPFMPFVTEEIWHALPGRRDSIMLAPFPTAHEEYDYPEAERAAATVMGVITGLRNIRGESLIHPTAKLTANVFCADDSRAALIAACSDTIMALAGCEAVNIFAEGEIPKGSATYLLEDITISVPLAGLVDAAAEIAKLERQRAKQEQGLAKVRAKLANERFLANAPAEVVAKEQEKLATMTASLEKIDATLARLREIA